MNTKIAYKLFRIYFPGDANDEEGNGNNINDVDESINEGDEVEGGASNLDYSSDEEVWREWLHANGGGPSANDSIDEKVGEEAGEHLVEEAFDDDEVESAASNLDDSSDDEVWQESFQYILNNRVSEHDETNSGDPPLGDSIDELQERIEHFVNNCVNVEGGVSNVDNSIEMLRADIERLENILDELKANGGGSYADDSIDEEMSEEAGEHSVEEAFDDDEVESAASNLDDSSDDEERQERIEMLREELERIRNILANLNSEYSVDSHSDHSVDSETDSASSVDFETDPASSVDSETDPATKQQIDALPTSVVSQELLGLFSKDICSICFGEFELDQEIKHPPCTHIFHTECLSTWLGKDRRCPYCRMSCIA